jgi:hypothetical protein
VLVEDVACPLNGRLLIDRNNFQSAEHLPSHREVIDTGVDLNPAAHLFAQNANLAKAHARAAFVKPIDQEIDDSRRRLLAKSFRRFLYRAPDFRKAILSDQIDNVHSEGPHDVVNASYFPAQK